MIFHIFLVSSLFMLGLANNVTTEDVKGNATLNLNLDNAFTKVDKPIVANLSVPQKVAYNDFYGYLHRNDENSTLKSE